MAISITFSQADAERFGNGATALTEAQTRAKAEAKAQGLRSFDPLRYSADWSDGQGQGDLTITFEAEAP